jgi:hypothetical protein
MQVMHLAAEKEMAFQWLPLPNKCIVVQMSTVCYLGLVSADVFFLKHWFHFILYGVAPNVALESNCKWKPLS